MFRQSPCDDGKPPNADITVLQAARRFVGNIIVCGRNGFADYSTEMSVIICIGQK